MSLYNMIFGRNPMAGILLQALNITPDDVPRFRDCYLDEEGDEPRIAVHTRTGGGNRDMYECEERARDNYPEYFNGEDAPSGPWNADLRKIDGFIYDEDDDYDCTYATFFYRVPQAFRPIIDELRQQVRVTDKPSDRWRKVLEDLRSASSSPETERALAVGEEIISALARAEGRHP